MTKIVVNLPMPPSVNALWRANRGRVHKSKVYISWLAQAGMEWLTQKKSQPKSLPGHFKAILILNEELRGQSDADNKIKAALDFCKIHGLIVDDKLCDVLFIKWGAAKKAPLGAKLTLFG